MNSQVCSKCGGDEFVKNGKPRKDREPKERLRCKRCGSEGKLTEKLFTKIVKLSDVHVPFEDRKAFMIAIKFLVPINPDKIIIDEWTDFYPLSRFDKDPKRALTLQEDLDKTKEYYKILRDTFPYAEIIQVESNHDARLKKFLNSNAKALAYLKCLELESLLDLERFNIQYKPLFIYNNVVFKHGDKVANESGFTAKAEFMKEGMSGNSGHTHRLGTYYKTLRGGKYVWLEGGCLCQVDPEYITGIANWQQGISLWTFNEKSGRYFAEVIPIINHKIMYGGVIYS